MPPPRAQPDPAADADAEADATGSCWMLIVEGRPPRWSRAVRATLLDCRRPEAVPRVVAADAPQVLAQLELDAPPVLLGLEVTRGALAERFDDLARWWTHPAVCPVALVRRGDFGRAATDHLEAALSEAGAAATLFSPRDAGGLLAIASRHAAQVWRRLEHRLPPHEIAWRRLPWQPPPWALG
ncbi:MAG: hypothetical protein AAF790_07055 [Planctomycetota bacterium]